MRQLYVLGLLLLMGNGVLAQKADHEKLTFYLMDKVSAYNRQAAAAHRAGETAKDQLLLVLVQADSENVLTSAGCTVLDHVGDVYFTLLYLSQIAELTQNDRIQRIELNPIGRKPQMDVTPALVKADKTTDKEKIGSGLTQAYDGTGVLVGICDTGFDFMHPMFYKADGTARIKWAWDACTGRGATEGYLGIGSLYDTPEKLAKAHGTRDSMAYHGTHVAGIAAGSSVVGGKYRGIATGADIALFHNEMAMLNGTDFMNMFSDQVEKELEAVKNKQEVKDILAMGKTEKLDYSVVYLLGIKHFFDYADEHHMPAVLNCSFGSMQSLWKDDALEHKIYDTMAAKEGHLIVVAAGNNGNKDYYRHKKAGEVLKGDTLINSGKFYFTAPTGKNFKLILRLDDAKHTEITFEPKEYDEDKDIEFKTTDVASYFLNSVKKKKYNDQLTVWEVEYSLPFAGFVHGEPAVALTIEGEAEIILHTDERATYFKNAKAVNCPYTLGTPGSYDKVLTIGATNHRANFTNLKGKTETSNDSNKNPLGSIISWSSAGPTFKGTVKPEVTAPGFNVISCLNSNLQKEEFNKANIQDNLIEKWTSGGRDYYMMATSGTSMATPVVTGIMALWLQADPTLNYDKVMKIIKSTATKLDAAPSEVGSIYGYGEIDAYQGLLKVLEEKDGTNIAHLSKHPVRATLQGNTIRIEGISGPTQVTLYSMSGRVVMKVTTENGQIELPRLPAAVYAVQVGNMGSTLIRVASFY